MRSPKYETCQPKMNESFFKTIDLVLVASSSSICHIGGKTPKTYRFFIGILCLFSDIRFFIDYYFCRDFGKSFHTCTNRGNCQKSKLFPWPKTTLWHLPTSYVSIFFNLSIFSVEYLSIFSVFKTNILRKEEKVSRANINSFLMNISKDSSSRDF